MFAIWTTKGHKQIREQTIVMNGRKRAKAFFTRITGRNLGAVNLDKEKNNIKRFQVQPLVFPAKMEIFL